MKPTDEQINEYRKSEFIYNLKTMIDHCKAVIGNNDYRPCVDSVYFDCIQLIEQFTEVDVDHYIEDYPAIEQLTREERERDECI